MPKDKFTLLDVRRNILNSDVPDYDMEEGTWKEQYKGRLPKGIRSIEYDSDVGRGPITMRVTYRDPIDFELISKIAVKRGYKTRSWRADTPFPFRSFEEGLAEGSKAWGIDDPEFQAIAEEIKKKRLELEKRFQRIYLWSERFHNPPLIGMSEKHPNTAGLSVIFPYSAAHLSGMYLLEAYRRKRYEK